MLLQLLINGLITGFLYTLTSLAFALVYNTTRIFHIVLAVLYVAAAYVFWQLVTVLHLPVILALVCSCLLTGGLSVLVERMVYFPLFKSRASLNMVFVSSIGVFTVLTNLVSLYWGNETKIFSAELGSVVTLGNVIISEKQLMQLGTAAVFILLCFTLLNFSRTGLHIKALRDDPELYQVMGYSLPRIRLIVFMLSGILVAVASGLTAWDVGMNPRSGMPFLLTGIVALVIGGIGRFESCVIGGLFIGILQALVIWQWSAQWVEAITFIILLIFLFIRPQGFMGEKSRVV